MLTKGVVRGIIVKRSRETAKKPKAKSLKGKPLEREHRTLKIKQREKEWNL